MHLYYQDCRGIIDFWHSVANLELKFFFVFFHTCESSNQIPFTVPRSFLSLSMLSRCTNLDIAMAAPACTGNSANDRRRRRVIAMLRHGIGKSRNISMHALKFSADVSPPRTNDRRYIAEQRRAVGEHSASCTKVQNVPDTLATHQ